MSGLVFAFMQAFGGDERESLLLARSLREFGGDLADSPLWMMMPEGVGQVSEGTLRALEALGVQVHRFEVPEEALHFLFGGKVFAAAAAEKAAENQADILVWMDSDTIFTGEPSEFLLETHFNLGYRPVMLKNISLLQDEPLNGFWEFIYDQCGTLDMDMFSMTTTVDETVIRPQFNAGILCVRPKKHLLQHWQENFDRLYQRPELKPFYQEHVLYYVFVHQSILAATLLQRLTKDETKDLGVRINLPMFLDAKPDLTKNAVTLRYDEYKYFADTSWKEKLNLDETVKLWLQEQV